MAASAMNLGSFTATIPTRINTHRPFSLRPTLSFPLLASPQHFPKTTNAAAGNGSWSTATSVKTAVAAAGSTDSIEKQETSSKKYYFVVANAKFMLDEEEHFQEQLSERLQLFEERNTEQDFWLVIEPKFMKLRLDRVLSESFEANSLEEALACNPAKIEFDQPQNWVAPYPKYEFGWWKPFLPPSFEKQEV
ncbi:hypothetical protein RJ640_025259 [Escallonia rubra]|uniref:Ycf54 n=1 Tax=Escallonia rubra TaxID=112253 RepID=A0AA88UF16_9ASTE|nr:hypothetical protein RJ640_025259 [Escallonia rubra]